MGFGAKVMTKKELDSTNWMSQAIPQDFVKFGLIPELVGRLPVIASLKGLDEEALIKILVEPKNSLIKQYKRLFEFDKVDLEFKESALKAVAKKAIERKIGARGLRSIIEETLERVMFDVPSDHTIEKVVIDDAVVNGKSKPKYVYNEDREPVIISINSDKVFNKHPKSSDAS